MLGETQPDVPAALRIVRHRLEQARLEHGTSVVGVTSARDGEGKSTLAAQLALVLSESQRARVVLVEACFERPSLARLLGVTVPPGLSLSVQLARRLQYPAEPLSVLALGPSIHAALEAGTETRHPGVLHSPQFCAAVAALALTYDFVIVDGPSVLGSGDANVIEEVVDGLVLAARSGVSKGLDVREVVRQLGHRKVLGLVLWDTKGKKKRR
jgi:Mrp family chromosome partitioning ATPase